MANTPIDDRRAGFLIAVGDLCQHAALARLAIEVTTASGVSMRGVPSAASRAEGEREVDDTGYAPDFHVGGTPMCLPDVMSCTVFSPPPAPAV